MTEYKMRNVDDIIDRWSKEQNQAPAENVDIEAFAKKFKKSQRFTLINLYINHISLIGLCFFFTLASQNMLDVVGRLYALILTIYLTTHHLRLMSKLSKQDRAVSVTDFIEHRKKILQGDYGFMLRLRKIVFPSLVFSNVVGIYSLHDEPLKWLLIGIGICLVTTIWVVHNVNSGIKRARKKIESLS